MPAAQLMRVGSVRALHVPEAQATTAYYSAHTVSVVDFHPVKACCKCIASALPVQLDIAGQLRRMQLAWHWVGLLALGSDDLPHARAVGSHRVHALACCLAC